MTLKSHSKLEPEPETEKVVKNSKKLVKLQLPKKLVKLLTLILIVSKTFNRLHVNIFLKLRKSSLISQEMSSIRNIVALFLLLYVATPTTGSVVGKNCTRLSNLECDFKVNYETQDYCWMPTDHCLKEQQCLCEASPPESIYAKCQISWFCRAGKVTTTTTRTTTMGPAKSGLRISEIIGIVVSTVIICLFIIFGCLYYYLVHVYIPSIVG